MVSHWRWHWRERRRRCRWASGTSAGVGGCSSRGEGLFMPPPFPEASADYITALPPDFRETVKLAREKSGSCGRWDRDIIDSEQPRHEVLHVLPRPDTVTGCKCSLETCTQLFNGLQQRGWAPSSTMSGDGWMDGWKFCRKIQRKCSVSKKAYVHTHTHTDRRAHTCIHKSTSCNTCQCSILSNNMIT